MERRDLLKTALGLTALSLAGCGIDRELSALSRGEDLDKPTLGRLKDLQTYAYYQAFYGNQTLRDLNQRGDGTSYKMPILKADDVYSGKEWENVEFWHSHGQRHLFSVTRAEFAQLLQGETVYVFTTQADGHWHCVKIEPKFESPV